MFFTELMVVSSLINKAQCERGCVVLNKFSIQNLKKEWKKRSYRSISSLHSLLFRPAQSSFTPESFRLLSLRSSILRLRGCLQRTVDRSVQLSSVRLQRHSLGEYTYCIRMMTSKIGSNIFFIRAVILSPIWTFSLKIIRLNCKW